jgi:uncharacterized protein YndB with AHSA1/START domain
MSDKETVITRTFDAPRELVFRAFTDPAHVDHWWGPKGFTITTRSMDVRPGGEWRFVMRGPSEWGDFENRIVYDEIVPPERLVYTHDSGEDNDPGRFHVTVSFNQVQGNKTELTMRSEFATKEARDFVVREYGAIERGKETLESLAKYLSTLQKEQMT